MSLYGFRKIMWSFYFVLLVFFIAFIIIWLIYYYTFFSIDLVSSLQTTALAVANSSLIVYFRTSFLFCLRLIASYIHHSHYHRIFCFSVKPHFKVSQEDVKKKMTVLIAHFIIPNYHLDSLLSDFLCSRVYVYVSLLMHSFLLWLGITLIILVAYKLFVFTSGFY